VDRQNDVDAFARLGLGVRAGAGPGERDDEERERQISQREDRWWHPATDARPRRQYRSARKYDRVLATQATPHPPRRQQQQQPQRFGRVELEKSEDTHAARSLAAAARFAGSDAGFKRAST